ncbi:MAG: putative sensor histidine kinase [Verrucomicrobiaceae bacterium]|nr:putative sensor histidine kinase [Verrucomicrobiaceae bacterium]
MKHMPLSASLIPNTIFARLFALILIALICSQIISSVVFFTLGPSNHFAPPPAPEPMNNRAPSERDMFVFNPRPPGPPFEQRPLARHRWLNPGFIMGFTVQFLALAIAAWFGARTIARPIQQLRDSATKIGDNINTPPMAAFGPDEIREATHVLNRMQERIRSQLEERGRFLAAVSHDLRTPLTRMRLRVTHIADNFDKEKMNNDIDEMAAMLDATLNYLRGEAQTENWNQLDIQALVETIAEDAQESGFAVTVSGSANPLLAQPQSLRRCISNLVANAVQYAGHAELSINDSTTSVIIEVIDHGPGIPENKINSVFEPFVRLEVSRNKNTGGVGLGLAIAREAALRNGGELTLRNAPGGGLIARLTLPRK